MNFIPAPITPNEEGRNKAVEKLSIVETDQNDQFYVYTELAKTLSGADFALVSLMQEDTQYIMSSCGFPEEASPTGTTNNREKSLCFYALLSPEPTLIPDCREHENAKYVDAIKNGSAVGYAGFPIVNKDNYTLGVLCCIHSKVLKISEENVEILKRMMVRLAQQLDTQTEQRELTAKKIVKSVELFQDKIPDTTIDEFLTFTNLCSGLDIKIDKIIHLKNLGYVKKNIAGNAELTSAGKRLQEEMGLKTKTFNKIKVEGDKANAMIDEMMNQLGSL